MDSDEVDLDGFYSHCPLAESHRKFSEFRRDRKFCDVTLLVGDETFYCHRLVLAAGSIYFEMMFYGSFSESTSRAIRLHEMDAASFGAILTYLYEGTMVSINLENVFILFDTAHFLQVGAVVVACEEYLLSNIGHPSMDLYEMLSIRTRCSANLKNQIGWHIVYNFKRFAEHDEFVRLPFDDMDFVLQEYLLSYIPFKNKELLSRALLRWIYASQERKMKFALVSDVILDFLANLPEDDEEFVTKEDASGAAKDGYEPEPSSSPEDAPTIHFFTEDFSRDASYKFQIISLSDEKVEPSWMISRQYCGAQMPEFQEVQVFATLNDSFYCFKYARGTYENPVFHSYASLDFPFDTPSQVLAEFRLSCEGFYDFKPQMCGVGTDEIYLYRGGNRRTGVSSEEVQTGGFSYEEFQRGIFLYKNSVNKWLPVPGMNFEMEQTRLVTDNQLIFTFGGVKKTFDPTSAGYVHQAYDPRSSRWLTLPRSSYPYVMKPFADVANERIYLHNGHQMEAYDHRAARWETIDSDLSFLRNETSVRGLLEQFISFDNKLYLFYKKSGEQYFRVYDPEPRILSREMSLDVNNVSLRRSISSYKATVFKRLQSECESYPDY